MIIPSGWIHCVYTPTDSLVIGGNFLHSFNIATQLRVYQIELNTKVPKKFRYPYFVSLLWYVAHHFALQIQKPNHGISTRVLQGLKALSAFLIEQAYRISEGAEVSAERRRVALDNIPWQLIDDPEKMSNELQNAVHAALGEETPPVTDPPTFDAQDFLEDISIPALSSDAFTQHGSASVLSANGNKRKAGEDGSAESPSSKTAKFKHFAKTKPPASTGARSAQSERIERSTPAAISSTTFALRQRPASPAFDFDEADSQLEAQKVRQKAEVKTTTAENLVKKTVQGPEDGSWIVETRRVVTTIERVYFPPLSVDIEGGAKQVVQTTSVLGADIVKPTNMPTQNGVLNSALNDIDNHTIQHDVGCSVAADSVGGSLRAEISKMLDLAHFNTSSKFTTEVVGQ